MVVSGLSALLLRDAPVLHGASVLRGILMYAAMLLCFYVPCSNFFPMSMPLLNFAACILLHSRLQLGVLYFPETPYAKLLRLQRLRHAVKLGRGSQLKAFIYLMARAIQF